MYRISPPLFKHRQTASATERKRKREKGKKERKYKRKIAPGGGGATGGRTTTNKTGVWITRQTNKDRGDRTAPHTVVTQRRS